MAPLSLEDKAPGNAMWIPQTIWMWRSGENFVPYSRVAQIPPDGSVTELLNPYPANVENRVSS